MTLELKSKAQTLEELRPVIQSASVLPVYRFFAQDYQKNKSSIIVDIVNKFGNQELIVRSSSANEDNDVTSHAGGFDSVLNVKNEEKEIQASIQKVINSYDSVSEKDEVFVQPMLSNVSQCGVVFTVDIDTLSPYYIISYDTSGSTTSVTSGSSNNLETQVVYKYSSNLDSSVISSIINTAKECEVLYGSNTLDIEFAICDKEVCVLQVREIITKNKEDLSHIDLKSNLEKIEKKLVKLNKPHPNLLGSKTIFGLMPDWNPAEIIGTRPKKLALSLYKELVTDSIWAYQRDNYGYRNLRSHPLLVSFLGVPFIDVRVSFNSFIPKDLEPCIAEKLVDYYLNKLEHNPHFHDKVEFDIVYSCYHLSVDDEMEELAKNGFSQREIESIKTQLLKLTNKIINITDGLYKKDLDKIDVLSKKRTSIVNSELATIDKIYWLIEDIKRYGTLPFAGVARAGFIAIQMLKSFVKTDIISSEEYDKFLTSLNTVSKKLSKDISSLPKDEFLAQYGHLRPGTYDITSARYDVCYERYFENKTTSGPESEDVDKCFTFSPEQMGKIDSFLESHFIESNAKDLVSFITEAIEGRELSKFEFTKSLSLVIEYISDLGGKYGFNRDQLAFLDVQVIRDLYSSLDHRDLSEIISSNINMNMQYYDYTKAIKLPSVIFEPSDIYSFSIEQEQANFITQSKIKAEVIVEDKTQKSSLEGKIVCVPSADPGFDYLFSHNISGLITCYGGANSHMAIRCAELGIPAVIGCGEALFQDYSKAKYLEIDAGNKTVSVL